MNDRAPAPWRKRPAPGLSKQHRWPLRQALVVGLCLVLQTSGAVAAPPPEASGFEAEPEPTPRADTTPDAEPGATPTPANPTGTVPVEPPAIPALTDDDRRTLAAIARELPQHGRPALPTPAVDAPEAAWLDLARQLAWVFAPRRMTRKAREALVATQRPLGPVLRAMVPTHRRYRLLQKALERAARVFPWEAPPIPETRHRLRVGRTAPEIALVRGRLLRDGYGDPNVEGRLATFFDDRLKRALQRWQKDHGLPYTSVIDNHTRRVLNEDRVHPVATLMLALERWRALDLRHDDGRTIIVHINTYRLFAEEGGQAVLTMPVIVGKATERDATPATSALLEAVIANPRWVVPPRITDETLRPSVKDDPAKLIERGFEVEVLADGRWRVRMGPGPENPLGRVKFTLVGTSGVYLHDTPGKAAFKRGDRSLSHGCVRVADAENLARWLLPDDAEGLETALILGGRSQAFKTTKPLTVHLVYQTVSADESFQIQRHDDLYQLDAPLLTAIDPLPVIRALQAPAAATPP